MSCDVSLLDELQAGELPPAQADLVRAHAASCGACTAELTALRRERALFAARRSPPVAHLRRPVLARCLETSEQKSRRQSVFTAAMAVAATLLLVAVSARTRVQTPDDELGFSSTELCSFAPSGPSRSAALHCGGGDLVAQSERRFSACLVASPGLGEVPGANDACE